MGRVTNGINDRVFDRIFDSDDLRLATLFATGGGGDTILFLDEMIEAGSAKLIHLHTPAPTNAISGNWSVSYQGLRVQGSSVGYALSEGSRTCLLSHDALPVNVTYEMKVDNVTGAWNNGLYFRSANTTTTRWLLFCLAEDSTLYENSTVRQTQALTLPGGTYYIKVKLVGNEAFSFFNDTPLFSGASYTTDVKSNGAGALCNNSAIQFDWFKITEQT